MSRTFLILPLAAAVLAISAMLAPAMAQSAERATTIKGSKSNGSEVTRVDAKARTFTATTTEGKQLTFIVAKGKPLPEVGKRYDITYTESPGGGPLQATTVNGSKSNSDLRATTVNSSRSNGSEVTRVDAKARTFTALAKGQQLTFIVAKGKPLPKVGKRYDITYIESPGGGPLQAVTVNGSRSNQND